MAEINPKWKDEAKPLINPEDVEVTSGLMESEDKPLFSDDANWMEGGRWLNEEDAKLYDFPDVIE